MVSSMSSSLLFAVILKLSSLITKAQDFEDEEFDYDCYYSDWNYLTASTTSPWASRCTVLTGNIRIGLPSNFTEGQLEKLFQNISTIRGSIVVEGTNLKRLNFLKNVVKMNTFYSTYVLEIIDNPLLTSVNLDKFNSSDGIFRIQRNPQLDVSSLCSRLNRVLDKHWAVTGNKVNCGGFYLDFPLTFTSILNVPPNLTLIQGDVILEDTGIPHERLLVLSTVKKIAGCFSVRSTNLETLSFFENLEEIDCRDRSVTASIDIYSNNYLNYLGLSKLTKITAFVPPRCQWNRILEITYDEVNVLMSTGLPMTKFNGIMSTENLPWDACIFNSPKTGLITISPNCTSLIGFLHYENRTIPPLEIIILNRIRHIYGHIKLVNVSITDLSMFSELERVIALDDSVPAIELDSMSALESIEMPKLKLVYSSNIFRFAIHNCPNINVTLSVCETMMNISDHAFHIDYNTCDRWIEDKAMDLELT
uniref:Protein kinase domain-containing protein n=1 Tax=Haemonchus contortus TaxID=6289 RepID=A0A7I4XXB9_HAECO